jgi:hypothetical protein
VGTLFEQRRLCFPPRHLVLRSVLGSILGPVRRVSGQLAMPAIEPAIWFAALRSVRGSLRPMPRRRRLPAGAGLRRPTVRPRVSRQWHVPSQPALLRCGLLSVLPQRHRLYQQPHWALLPTPMRRVLIQPRLHHDVPFALQSCDEYLRALSQQRRLPPTTAVRSGFTRLCGLVRALEPCVRRGACPARRAACVARGTGECAPWPRECRARSRPAAPTVRRAPRACK